MTFTHALANADWTTLTLVGVAVLIIVAVSMWRRR